MITLENLYLKLCNIEDKLLSIERKELLEPHNEAFGMLEDHLKQCPNFTGFWLEEAITESKDSRFAQTCHHIKCSCNPSSFVVILVSPPVHPKFFQQCLTEFNEKHKDEPLTYSHG